MDKVPGLPLWQALGDNDISRRREVVFKMLRQLAEVRKTLSRHTRSEIGSLTICETYVVVERQLSLRNLLDGWNKIQSRPGPFDSSIAYYANLLQDSWRTVQKGLPTGEVAMRRWKIHAYLSSVLPSYVKPQDDGFILADTDLNSSNILVDPQTGSITGIIDWEFSCSVPFQATEHFPLLLRKNIFTDHFGDVYDDPEAELNEWRAFYANQFEGDPAMEECLQNIDAAIAFEDMLKDDEQPTVENLVEQCKFLESAEPLEMLEVPFPWKTPTKHRFPSPATRKTELARTSTVEKTEIAVQMEQISHDESPPTNGGDNQTASSPSSVTHTGHDERPAIISTTEKPVTAVTEQISHVDSPRTNGGDDHSTISPSQLTHDEPPTTPPLIGKMETAVQTEHLSPDLSPLTAVGVGVQTTFSLSPIIHTDHSETTEAIESTGAVTFESRSLNSFVGAMQRRQGLKVGLVEGINEIPRRVKSGGKAVWRVFACRTKGSEEESEKQTRRDV
jgi:hypothetical protein